MRSYDCECGFHADGADDEVLFYAIAAHERERHPEMALTAGDIRAMMARLAYDVPIRRPPAPTDLHAAAADRPLMTTAAGAAAS